MAILAPTELLSNRTDALMDLAEVLRLGGDHPGVAAAAGEAMQLCERKGNIASAVRVQGFLADL